MKILVFGAGVIGSYLTHILCAAHHDVTVIARGRWKQILEENGLRIRHHLQHRETLDYPKVIGSVDEAEEYDAVFAVMPFDKMEQVLEPLAKIRTSVIVLVGNNTDPEGMQSTILEQSVSPREVLFGFQGTAGKRDWETGRVICERLGKGSMDIGGLHKMPASETRQKLEAIFAGTGYRMCWQPDMAAFLLCHQAMVLPICYLAYTCGTDLRKATGKQRKQMLLATREAYGLLAAQGVPILPEGDEKYFEPGIGRMMLKVMYFGMSKIGIIGDLIACEHCRNAYDEMQELDAAFEKIIAKSPEYPMPNWNALKAQMPDWRKIRSVYGKRNSESMLELKNITVDRNNGKRNSEIMLELQNITVDRNNGEQNSENMVELQNTTSDNKNGHNFWDLAAGPYDFFITLKNGKVNRKMCVAVARLMEPEDRVLECACGTGMISAYIAGKCADLTATDFSEGMLKRTEKKCRRLDNVHVEQADITKLHYADNSFDKIVAANVIHLLDDPQVALDELLRVCKPGGKIIIPTYINNENEGRPGAFVKIVGKLGADFKDQFTYRSYKEFFLQKGYKCRFGIIRGSMPCAIVVISQQN